MEQSIEISRVTAGPQRRHESRVRTFSRDYRRLRLLDGLVVSEGAILELIDAVCALHGAAPPSVRLHAKRSMYTGATEPPRSAWVARYGEARVRAHEAERGKSVPESGILRLGRTTTLMTLAHELGHHLVHVLDDHRTPDHGKRWVGRFDDAADAIVATVGFTPEAPGT